MKTVIHLCQFDSTLHLRGRARTYELAKAAVLEAGGFSVFEATASRASADLFTRLEADPEVERYERPFPWIGLRQRAAAGRPSAPQ